MRWIWEKCDENLRIGQILWNKPDKIVTLLDMGFYMENFKWHKFVIFWTKKWEEHDLIFTWHKTDMPRRHEIEKNMTCKKYFYFFGQKIEKILTQNWNVSILTENGHVLEMRDSDQNVTCNPDWDKLDMNLKFQIKYGGLKLRIQLFLRNYFIYCFEIRSN